MGDGTKCKPSRDTYYSKSLKLVESIQVALFNAGIHARLLGPYRNATPFGVVDMYHLSRGIKNTEKVKVVNFRVKEKKTKKHGSNVNVKHVENVSVVCFEVPNSTLITMNKGRTSIHGNCKHASHAIRLMRMGLEILKFGEVNVYREFDRHELLDIRNGKWTYEAVLEEAERLDRESEAIYVNKTYKVPYAPDKVKINELYKELIKLSSKT